MANRLNVRSRPSLQGNIIGQLTENTILSILGHRDNWFEVKFEGSIGFVHSDYVRRVESEIITKGRIISTRLNVRSQPDIHSQGIGSLVKGTVIDILAEQEDWLEIGFNDQSAFVHRDYVELMETGSPKHGLVNTQVLNVRRAPALSGEILGSLRYDTEVNILSQVGSWYEIRFNESTAFIHKDYIEITREIQYEGPLTISPNDKQKKEIEEGDLTPENKLRVSGTKIEKKVSRIWNKYGGLLELLSGSFNLDPAITVAVLGVESSGKGFESTNQNRMIIRFENHLFWKYWGKKHAETFHEHFQYGEKDNGRLKVWLGHLWRENVAEEWQSFHGIQTKEWQVLDYARSWDETAALFSISMGAPQIMGFNHKKIGYNTVQDMFKMFKEDIQYQIRGMFDFFNDSMIKALQKKDFVQFAEYYNGSGQKYKYGEWIQSHYEAFQKLTA